MALFFMVERQKQHILVEARESGTVDDIKNIISGVTQIPQTDITIKSPTDEARTTWKTINSDKTLQEHGFTRENAKSQDPAPLAYTIPDDGDAVTIEALSEPAPV